jgi:hypothetical protein
MKIYTLRPDTFTLKCQCYSFRYIGRRRTTFHWHIPWTRSHCHGRGMEGVGVEGVGGGQQEGAAGATRSKLSFIAELTKFCLESTSISLSCVFASSPLYRFTFIRMKTTRERERERERFTTDNVPLLRPLHTFLHLSRPTRTFKVSPLPKPHTRKPAHNLPNKNRQKVLR